MDTVFVRGIRFFGHHGVEEAERTLGQTFVVDVEMFLDLTRAGREDTLTATVNYAEAHRIVVEIGEKERFLLLEALAERIAQALLDRWPVARVRVRATKPSPPIPGTLEAAGVEIIRDAPR